MESCCCPDYDNAFEVVSKLIDDGYFIIKTKANSCGFYNTAIIETTINNL